MDAFMLHPTSGRIGFDAPAPPHAANCDQCGVNPIRGVRYKCAMCPNYDLCQNCIEPAVRTHDASHLFVRIDAASAAAVAACPIAQNRATIRHTNVTCSGCGARDFCGFRFQCVQCMVDLCEACEARGVHDASHARMKISQAAACTAAAAAPPNTAAPALAAAPAAAAGPGLSLIDSISAARSPTRLELRLQLPAKCVSTPASPRRPPVQQPALAPPPPGMLAASSGRNGFSPAAWPPPPPGSG